MLTYKNCLLRLGHNREPSNPIFCLWKHFRNGKPADQSHLRSATCTPQDANSYKGNSNERSITRHLHFFDHLSNHFILTWKSLEWNETKGSFCYRQNIFWALVAIFLDFFRFFLTFFGFKAAWVKTKRVKMRQKKISTEARKFLWFDIIFLDFVSFWRSTEVEIMQVLLNYLIRWTITVLLTSCLIGLYWTKQLKLLIMLQLNHAKQLNPNKSNRRSDLT